MVNSILKNSFFKIYGSLGALQLFNIILAIIRTKLISIFFGPTGLGLFDTYNLNITIIYTLCSCGLSNYLISLISPLFNNGDLVSLNHELSFYKKIFLYISFFSLIIGIILSPLLSNLFFKSYNKTLDFILLSIPIFLTTLTSLNTSILQCSRNINLLIKNTVVSGLLIIISVIIIIQFNIEKSLVIILISISIINYITTTYNLNKIGIKFVVIKNKKVVITILELFKSSIFIAMSGLLPLIHNYIIRIYLYNNAKSDIIGYYSSAINLTNSYIMIIFSTMSLYYYPELASIKSNDIKTNKLVNKQIITSILLITPLILFLFLVLNYLITLLYSKDFIFSSNMIIFSLCGILFKCVCWSLTYLFYAKSKTIFLIIIELFALLIGLISSFILFNFIGLDGIGLSISLTNFILMIYIIYISKLHNNFSFKKQTRIIFILCNIFLLTGVILFFYVENLSLKLLFYATFILLIFLYNKFYKKLI
jgi:O-antigen/teichoic acid export membrane protein